MQSIIKLIRMGGDYSEFYVGISNDAERRLFDEHKVNREKGIWIYCPTESDDVARKVEKNFLDKGCAGGTGGGEDDTTYVYCYKMTSTTVE